MMKDLRRDLRGCAITSSSCLRAPVFNGISVRSLLQHLLMKDLPDLRRCAPRHLFAAPTFSACCSDAQPYLAQELAQLVCSGDNALGT
jgi:hypothetical protein